MLIILLNTEVETNISKRVLEFPMTFFSQVFEGDLEKTKEMGYPSTAVLRNDSL